MARKVPTLHNYVMSPRATLYPTCACTCCSLRVPTDQGSYNCPTDLLTYLHSGTRCYTSPTARPPAIAARTSRSRPRSSTASGGRRGHFAARSTCARGRREWTRCNTRTALRTPSVLRLSICERRAAWCRSWCGTRSVVNRSGPSEIDSLLVARGNKEPDDPDRMGDDFFRSQAGIRFSACRCCLHAAHVNSYQPSGDGCVRFSTGILSGLARHETVRVRR